MKLTFIGATHEVTGSCTLLSVAGKNILIDYGMEQGKDMFVNEPIPLPVDRIDCVLLTHAHIDHSGLLPVLYQRGFDGPVHATQATCRLSNIMLLDSANIQESEAEWQNRKAERSGQDPVEPLYTTEDAQRALSHFVGHPYGTRETIFPGILDVRFLDAGHLLGSAHIEAWVTENGITKKIVFSGDIGNHHQPLLSNPTLIQEADYVMIESTYGNRYHQIPADYATALADVIQSTFDRGGSVIIPSFAVGRTQEMLYFIREIKQKHLVHGHDGFKVYLDSPLAVAATRVFVENQDSCYDESAKELLKQGINPIAFEDLVTAVSTDESKAINNIRDPKIILSASGMCEAGRIRHHIKHNAWNSANTILFVGYQASGTLGRLLCDGAKSVKLFGETIAVNAEIKILEGTSSHADREGLMNWANAFSPAPLQVFVVHGDDDVCQEFAQSLSDECSIPASAPYSGSVFNLEECRYEFLASPVPVVRDKKDKASPAHSRQSAPYQNLLRALERLTSLIKNGSGRSNGELKKVAEQLNKICDKWELS